MDEGIGFKQFEASVLSWKQNILFNLDQRREHDFANGEG